MTSKLMLAVIAGADAALKYKQKNPRANDSEVMKYIAESASRITENIDID